MWTSGSKVFDHQSKCGEHVVRGQAITPVQYSLIIRTKEDVLMNAGTPHQKRCEPGELRRFDLQHFEKDTLEYFKTMNDINEISEPVMLYEFSHFNGTSKVVDCIICLGKRDPEKYKYDKTIFEYKNPRSKVDIEIIKRKIKEA